MGGFEFAEANLPGCAPAWGQASSHGGGGENVSAAKPIPEIAVPSKEAQEGVLAQ
jgi:hypothetical protein